jgi:hypothetical protein
MTTPVTDLAERVAQACARISLQHSAELYEAMDDGEITAEQRLHQRSRAKARRHRGQVFDADLASSKRQRRESERIRRHDERQRRWHARAQAARLRFTSPDAQVATLHRKASWSSLRLRAVIGVGLVWSAINVGRNLAPTEGPTGPTWWMLWILSFAIEAMISVPILEIMSQAAAAARLGQQVERTKIFAFEAALLVATVSLNCGPHVAAGDLGRAAEYAVAPVMVVVLMWLHAWISGRYATLISAVTTSAEPIHAHDDPRAAAVARSEQPGWEPAEFPSPGAAFVVPANHTGPPVAAATANRHLTPVTVWPADTGPVVAQVASPPRAPAAPDPQGAPATDIDPEERYIKVAQEMVWTKASQKRIADIVDILRMADQGLNANAVATHMTHHTQTDWPRSTVDRIIKGAKGLGFRTTDEQEALIPERTAINQAADPQSRSLSTG